MSAAELGLSLLLNQSALSLLFIFWYTLVFEIPRYGFPVLALALGYGASTIDRRWSARPPSRAHPIGLVSVIVVGHNEAHSLDLCVRSLREQSYDDLEIIIVSDGSFDATRGVAARLVRQGLATRMFATDLRAGKSAGINLALAACRGEVIVNVDCDCSYDRFAIEELLKAFDDPTVGGACGDIRPRNGDASLVARFQEIEYLLAISLGKLVGTAVDQVTCLSGAFGGFRKEALLSVGAFDVGGGEDLDVTLRLRARGWRTRFVPGAICYTDVPDTFLALVRQRQRWERDCVRLRYRKHRAVMMPHAARFDLAEAAHQWEFFVFNVVGSVAFPFYLVWLFATYGDSALPILIAMQLGLFLLDGAVLLLAGAITGQPVLRRMVVYLIGFSVFTSYVMRFVRLWAYLQEWLLFASTRDNYVPHQVRVLRKW